jgi:hypothetical protein
MKEVPRRIVVSALASLLLPVLGDRSLLAVSIAGYVLLGAALYMLLRFRFTPPYAAVATALTLLFPPLQRWSFAPMTDAWGLLFVVIALIAATLTIHGGRRWLFLWVPVIALGSITRESIAAAVITAGILTARRVRHATWLFVTGAAALIPAALLLRTSLRFTVVFALAASHRLGVPVDTSLGALIKHWAILAAVEPFWYLHTEPIWSTAILLTLGVALFARDATLEARVARAAALGAILCLATFPFISGLRAELVVLPAAAFGLALLAQDLVATGRTWRAATEKADLGDRIAT